MNPEILTALTAAKGVPFDGKGATSRELAEQAKWFDQAKARMRWNLPRGDRSIKPAEWTVAEAGMACHGMEEIYFFALRYQYALDDSVYYAVRRNLYAYAAQQRRRHRWPGSITTLSGPRHYLMLLVEMQLIEIRQPWRFIRLDSKAPGMCRTIVNVNKDTWARRLEPIYETLGNEFQRWISIGTGHMRRWLQP